MTNQKPAKQAAPQEPLLPKIAAWARVREIWLASGKNPHVTPELLDAEQDAKDTD